MTSGREAFEIRDIADNAEFAPLADQVKQIVVCVVCNKLAENDMVLGKMDRKAITTSAAGESAGREAGSAKFRFDIYQGSASVATGNGAISMIGGSYVFVS